MDILNEWSGKEWIAPEVIGKEEGIWLDVPKRLYIHFKYVSIIIGRNKSEGWIQGWLPFFGSIPPKWKWSWWPIVFKPRNSKPGWAIRKHPEWYEYKPSSKDSSSDA